MCSNNPCETDVYINEDICDWKNNNTYVLIHPNSGIINPFTALTCKMSRLKHACIHACKQYI